LERVFRLLLKDTEILGVYKNRKRETLGVVVTFRHSEDRPDELERMEMLLSVNRPDNVLIYIVDSGSPSHISELIKEMCLKKEAEYIYYPSSNEIFSIGRARDVGAMYSNTDFVFFQDLDLLPYDTFYHELINEIENQRLYENAYDFLMVPCLFLTQQGSKEYIQLKGKDRKSIFFEHFISNNKEKIHSYAPGTSALVVNRMHYLSIGGHQKEFAGHGFEDFELIHRLAYLSNKFSRPNNYYKDFKKWQTNNYIGFRSMFRLFGDILMMKGVFICHLWHPPYKKGSFYVIQNKKNADLLIQKMKEFDETKKHPNPLIDIYRGRTLALGKKESAFYKSLWQIMPYLGDVEFKSEYDFSSEEEFVNYFEKEKFDRVFMHNPYGNEKRLEIYQVLRKRKIKYIVAERGALPDSIFFDENGFNADSSSYDPKRWDRPLTVEEERSVEKYIEFEKFSDIALEHQGARIGKIKLAEKYQISHRKKVLFIPFQRPNDTVVKYFSGSVKDMDDFAKFVEAVANKLDDSWIVLAKKHPLEINTPLSNKILIVDEDTHIKDLLDLADAVLLINSGVGVLSMIWGKPVLYVGEVFYGHPKINVKVNTPEEAVRVLQQGFTVDMQTVKRFIHYLINEFYSFGKITSELVRQPDGSYINRTTNIQFYQIVFPGCKKFRGVIREQPAIPTTSPLFDRYRVYLESKEKEKKKEKEKVSLSTKESYYSWLTRQFIKLITDPKKFYSDFKRWLRKKMKKIVFTG